MFKRKSKRNESKLPESNIVLFRKAVQRLPYDLNESQIQALIKVIEYINLETTEHVVVKRNMSPGLYVVVSGKVEAVSSNGGIALRLIKKGDLFGEISTFFGSNCPVTIRAQEG
jgi:CRP-like cAMP-binding protein